MSAEIAGSNFRQMKLGGQTLRQQVQSQVFAPDVIRFHECEHQSAPAVEKPEPDEITPQKAPLRVHEHLQQPTSLTASVQGVCHEIGVTRHAIVMIGEASIREMLEVPLEAPHASRHLRVLVNLRADPATAPAVKESNQAIRVCVAVTQKPSKIIGYPRYRPTRISGESAATQRLNLTAQLAGDPLVGIQAKHPVAAGAVDGELLLRTVSRPIVLNDPGPQRAGNLPSRVRRMRINDYDLVAKAHRPQACLDPVRLIVSDYTSGQLHELRIAGMSSVLFYDPSCQRPYDTRTLHQQATGGTEASVTRIADALGAFVMQHNRTEAYGSYLPPGRIAGIEHVILNRESRALPKVRELYPDAKTYLWVHDQLNPGSKRGRRLASTAQHLRDRSVTIICVSDTQRRGVEATVRQIGVADVVRTVTIYNPVTDDLMPDGSAFDDRKLVFFSSPNKGLAFSLDAFRALHRRMPDLRLQVGNPGYKFRRSAAIDGVEYLGPQPQERIHKEVRTALCTFFPNFVLPETFGLVFAESKAVGTPILTCDCGAAAEIVGDPQQVLPVTFAQRAYETTFQSLSPGLRSGPARVADQLGLFDQYIERIRAWRAGDRPAAAPDPRFRLTAVANQWRAMLGIP